MIHQVEDLALDNQRQKIHEWLNPPDPSSNLNKAQKKRYMGTGSWFLDSQSFMEWNYGICQTLWLHGIPGCGKTVLSAAIIEHLKQLRDSSHIVLYFFFDFTDIDKQSTDKLVRSLISQLCSKCEDFRKELDRLYSSCGNGLQQPPYESLVGTFLQMVNFGKIRIVLDALDECKARTDLLSLLEDLTTAGCSLIATSRKEEDIESELKRWLHQDNMISVQQDAVNDDIRMYVRTRLRNDRGFERWRSRPHVQDEIEGELMEKADGM